MDKILCANFDVIDIANFWMNVKKIRKKTTFALSNGYCWEWQGTLFTSGYGHFVCHQNSYRAHRVSYYLYYKTIAKDNFICHKCDNVKCVNPKHLFSGSAKENTTDAKNKQRLVKSKAKRNKVSSKFYGVSFRNDTKKWRARCMVNYKNVLIGEFKEESEAASAYDEFVKELNKNLDKNSKFHVNFPLTQ